MKDNIVANAHNQRNAYTRIIIQLCHYEDIDGDSISNVITLVIYGSSQELANE